MGKLIRKGRTWCFLKFFNSKEYKKTKTLPRVCHDDTSQACKVHIKTRASQGHRRGAPCRGPQPPSLRPCFLRRAPLPGHKKGSAHAPLFLLEDPATSGSLVHDAHAGSWALHDLAGGQGQGMGRWPTVPPRCPVHGLWGRGSSVPHGGRGGTHRPSGAWASLLEWQQREYLQVSWEPRNNDLDQDEMSPGLGLNSDGQPDGRGCACRKPLSQGPSLAAPQLAPSLPLRPRLRGQWRPGLQPRRCHLLVCEILGKVLNFLEPRFPHLLNEEVHWTLTGCL